jgi:uncharacterized protein
LKYQRKTILGCLNLTVRIKSMEENNLKNKYEELKNYLKELGSVAVAFSGGVDSTFLMFAAKEALGDNAIAITANSDLFPKREHHEAIDFTKNQGIKHIIFEADEFAIEGFASNPENRCYLCKKTIFSTIQQLAEENGATYVAEGSNMDDNGDYRPGMQAITELQVKSPLRYVELYKDEIRSLSREFGLNTWSKPSFACLASRFVYGEEITKAKLNLVGKSEQFLLDLGFRQVRVRIHNNLARIEMEPSEFGKLMNSETRELISKKLKEFGFQYVSLDLQGYRTGSMNEMLL